MPSREIDFPVEHIAHVSTTVVCRWLGLSETTFLRMVGLRKDKPNSIIPGLSEWLRPVGKNKKGYTWDWLDIVAFRQVLKGRSLLGVVVDDEQN